MSLPGRALRKICAGRKRNQEWVSYSKFQGKTGTYEGGLVLRVGNGSILGNEGGVGLMTLAVCVH
jgi:hypothetical protein